MTPLPTSSSRCAIWPATASAVGLVHPAGDPAVDQEDHAVGVRRRDRVVGDHHDGLAEVVDAVAQQGEHLAGGAGVERAGRLVGEDDGRVGDQRAGDRDPLLLAAGQRAGQVPAAVAEADPLEQGADPRRGPAGGRRGAAGGRRSARR